MFHNLTMRDPPLFSAYLIILFQLRLLASDGGSPSKTATATVDIAVQRNLQAPQFAVGATYNVTIIEQTGIGEEILIVAATDTDPAVRF